MTVSSLLETLQRVLPKTWNEPGPIVLPSAEAEWVTRRAAEVVQLAKRAAKKNAAKQENGGSKRSPAVGLLLKASTIRGRKSVFTLTVKKAKIGNAESIETGAELNKLTVGAASGAPLRTTTGEDLSQVEWTSAELREKVRACARRRQGSGVVAY